MNPFLSDLYNTAEAIGADDGAEKLAQATLLDEMLSNEGLSIDDLDGDSLVKVAASVFGEDSPLVKAAQEDAEDDEEEDEEDDAQEKMAEADFLGRQMAHAYVNELAEIEKTAGIADWSLRSAGKGISDLAGKAHKQVGRLGGRVLGKERLGRMAKETQKAKALDMTSKARKGGATMKQVKRLLEPGKHGQGIRAAARQAAGAKVRKARNLAGYGTIGAGAAAAGGAAYGGKKLYDKKKQSSAIDILAEDYALGILKEAGYVDDDPQEKLASAVEQRAYEMLIDAGYEFED